MSQISHEIWSLTSVTQPPSLANSSGMARSAGDRGATNSSYHANSLISMDWPATTTLYFSQWHFLWLTFCYTLVLGTIAGNTVTLLTLYKMPTFRNSISNIYIGSLAAADLAVGAFVMTFVTSHNTGDNSQEMHTSFHHPLWSCELWQLIDLITCTVSLYSICAISLDRWFNLEKPLRIFKRSMVVARNTIAVIWILPVVIWVSIYTTLRALEVDENEDKTGNLFKSHLCQFKLKNRVLGPLLALCIFYVPVVLLLLVLCRIFIVIHSHVKFMHRYSNQSLLTSTAQRNFQVLTQLALKSGVHEYSHQLMPKVGSSNNVTKIRPETANSSVRVYEAVNSDAHSLGTDAPVNSIVLSSKCNGYVKTMPEPVKALLTVPKSTKIYHANDLNFVSSTGTCNSCLEFPTARQGKCPHMGKFGSDARLLLRSQMTFTDSASENREIFSNDSKGAAQAYSKGCAVVEKNPHRQVIVTRKLLAPRLSSISLNSMFNFRKHSLNALFSDVLPPPASNSLLFSQQIRAAKAVGLIAIVFLLCWMPFVVLWPLKIYCGDCVPENLYAVAIWANYLNSTFNPILYTLCSSRFRSFFRSRCEHFRKKCGDGKDKKSQKVHI